MRRLTVVALLLVAAASSSQCSDGDATAIGPSSGIGPRAGRFANTGGGSTQGDDAGVSGGGDSGPGSASSISRLALILVTDRNSDGRPNRGDSITFTIATTLPWDQVSVVCSQNGEVVLRAERTADAWTPLPLTSQTWQSGPAECKATLDQVKDTNVTTLASATFTAGA
jgi:hypothetical protein